MSKEIYKPNFLKITSIDEIHQVGNIHNVLKEYSEWIHGGGQVDDPFAINSNTFGFFQEIYRSFDWVILKFDPFSVDLNVHKEDTNYETRDSALKAGIEFLREKGYKATPFDLEGMIDAI